jgi:hypothetical protein
MTNLHSLTRQFLFYSHSGIMELNANGSLDIYPFLDAFAQQLLKPNFVFGIFLRRHGSERLLTSAYLSVRMDHSDSWLWHISPSAWTTATLGFGISFRPHGPQRLLALAYLSVRMDHSHYRWADFLNLIFVIYT